jgi:hypothetical protein
MALLAGRASLHEALRADPLSLILLSFHDAKPARA